MSARHVEEVNGPARLERVSAKDKHFLAHHGVVKFLTRERASPGHGSGAMRGLSRWGLVHEPTVAEAIGNGADIVLFRRQVMSGPRLALLSGARI